MTDLDTINNFSLIENGLSHVEYEISRPSPSYFRIGRESHLILYRSMIEALRGSANLAITGKPSKTRQRFYQIGNEPSKEIHKTKVAKCHYAWRFSEPVKANFPAINIGTQNIDHSNDDFLIPFYDALAMIQAECFMSSYVNSKVVDVSDDEMALLEWLHENIRNEYEHFIPRYYMAPINDLVDCSIICLRLSNKILFECGNVIVADGFSHANGLIQSIGKSLSELINKTPA
jgi:hypothetical protein